MMMTIRRYAGARDDEHDQIAHDDDAMLIALTFVQSTERPVEDAWLLEQNLVARVGWSPERAWLHGEEEGCRSVSA
jgi:hypothetical protein